MGLAEAFATEDVDVGDFQKLGAPVFGGPMIGIYSILRFVCGRHIHGNYHLGVDE